MYKKKIYFTATLTGLLLSGFLATSLISYNVAKKSLSRTISGETLPLTSDNVYSEILRDLLRPITTASTMSGNTFVRAWLENGEQDSQQISDYLGAVQQRFGTITAFLASERSQHYYHPRGILKTLDPADPADAWYYRFKESGEPHELNIDADTADRSRLSIFVNYPVQGSQGDFLGAIGIGLSMDSVRTLLEDYEQRYDRRIYLIDRQGRVTLRGSSLNGFVHFQEHTRNETVTRRVLDNATAQLSFRDSQGGMIYLNSRLVPELDWFLVVEQTSAEDEAALLHTLIINLLIALAVSAVVLLLAWATLGKYQRRLLEMATTDALTGATSRQAFENLFNHAVRGAKRRQQKLALLLIDLDHFKTINDRFGHHGGDRVLQAAAAQLSALCRANDVLCRWGGEEFLILMEDCGLDDARQRACAIRRAVASQPVRLGRETIGITLSIGVAEYREDESLPSLIRRADDALYAAKRNGRDRVEFAL